MAARSWARRAFTTTAVAAVGLLALAIPASAHKPDANAGCDKDTSRPFVSVTAVSYDLDTKSPNNLTPNSISVFVDGADKPAIEQAFGANFDNTKKPWVLKELDGKVDHSFKIVVHAFNDNDLEHEPFWSKVFNKKSGICDKTPPKESTPPPPPPNNPPAQQPPAPQPAVAPVGATGQLASTGVSIAIPIAIGALLLVGGAGLLLLMRRRGKA